MIIPSRNILPWLSGCPGPWCAPQTPPPRWSWPRSFWRCSASLFRTCLRSGRSPLSGAGGKRSFWWQSRCLQFKKEKMVKKSKSGFGLTRWFGVCGCTLLYTHDTTGHLLWFLSYWSSWQFHLPFKNDLAPSQSSPPTLKWVPPPCSALGSAKRRNHPPSPFRYSYPICPKVRIQFHPIYFYRYALYIYPSKWYFWPISIRMSFSYPLDGNEVQAFRISGAFFPPFFFFVRAECSRIVVWIADRVMNNGGVSGPDQWRAKKRGGESQVESKLSAGLRLFIYLFIYLFEEMTWPAAWSRVGNLSFLFLRNQEEDEIAERSESIFIWPW